MSYPGGAVGTEARGGDANGTETEGTEAGAGTGWAAVGISYTGAAVGTGYAAAALGAGQRESGADGIWKVIAAGAGKPCCGSGADGTDCSGGQPACAGAFGMGGGAGEKLAAPVAIGGGNFSP
jgi:hypothetical protein